MHGMLGFRASLSGTRVLTTLPGERLWQDLRTALGRLVNARSAEAAAFLYIDRQDARTRFEEILNDAQALSDVFDGPDGVPTEVFQSEFARLILAPKGPQADFPTQRSHRCLPISPNLP